MYAYVYTLNRTESRTRPIIQQAIINTSTKCTIRTPSNALIISIRGYLQQAVVVVYSVSDYKSTASKQHVATVHKTVRKQPGPHNKTITQSLVCVCMHIHV